MAISRSQIHLGAVLEARRAHRNLGIDPTRRIDPFEALQRSGVVVIRQRLDNVAGLYLPGEPNEGRPDGILINSAHPLSKQRYTAAHELSHHLHDRQAVLDADTDWLARNGAGQSAKELFAEVFAAWFLMPKQLVQSTLVRLEIEPAGLDGPGAYTLALELGTSYRATVHHLGTMGLIGRAHRQRLLALQPQSIKQDLGASDIAADAWKNVWLVGSSQDRQWIWPEEGDAVVLTFPEIPSSGYLWQAADVPPWLELVRSEYQVPAEEFAGGRGQRRFLFRVSGRGHQQVRFAMARPWESDGPIEAFQLDVAAQPKAERGEVKPELLAATGT